MRITAICRGFTKRMRRIVLTLRMILRKQRKEGKVERRNVPRKNEKKPDKKRVCDFHVTIHKMSACT